MFAVLKYATPSGISNRSRCEPTGIEGVAESTGIGLLSFRSRPHRDQIIAVESKVGYIAAATPHGGECNHPGPADRTLKVGATA
jgi:hypothetical protein